VQATYTYDDLDEVLSTTYTDSTPSASFAYNKGWRTSASNATSQLVYNTFDGLGRPTSTTQTTNGQPYPMSFTYNLAGGITTVTLPSGRTVTYTTDAGGRPIEVTGSLNGTPTTYVSSVSYATQGAAQQINLGNSLIEQTCYNSRLQPFVIRQRTGSADSCTSPPAPDLNDVGYLAFSFSPTQNNGNVTQQNITYGKNGTAYPSLSFVQTYSYDGVNRLTQVNETGPGTPWYQANGFDYVGNRWVSGGNTTDPFTPTSSSAIIASSNRLGNNGAQYDGAGNLKQIGGYQYGYDGENRLISSSANGTTYGYDADGKRVTKLSSGVTTVYVYDVKGDLASEVTTGGAPPASPCTTCYQMADHLGSVRMLTDSAGVQQMLYDYYPFGEELTTEDGRDARWGPPAYGLHFTGKEQEGYEGDYMHYFGARYYAGGQGRFITPDWSAKPQPVPYADLMDP